MSCNSPPLSLVSHLTGKRSLGSSQILLTSPLAEVPWYLTVLRPFTVSLPTLRQVPPGLAAIFCQSPHASSTSRTRNSPRICCAPGPWLVGNSMYILRSGISTSLVWVEKFTIIAPLCPLGWLDSKRILSLVI